MFNNLLIYRISKTASKSLEDGLAAQAFVECMPSQESSMGFEPPRGEENGAMVENVGGQIIVKFTHETKSVPKQAIDKKLKALVAKTEEMTGRKPGKREKKEMKEDIRHELMPQAFGKRSSTLCWMWPEQGLLVLDTASVRRGDNIVTALIRASDMAFSLLCTIQSPEGCMTTWLADEPPEDFTVDRDCELRASDESRATVRYAGCSLDIPEIYDRIRDGMTVSRLALTWDDRIRFELTDTMGMKKLRYIEAGKKPEGNPADSFDADVALATGELQHFLPALLDQLGGIKIEPDLVEQAQQATEEGENDVMPAADPKAKKARPRMQSNREFANEVKDLVLARAKKDGLKITEANFNVKVPLATLKGRKP